MPGAIPSNSCAWTEGKKTIDQLLSEGFRLLILLRLTVIIRPSLLAGVLEIKAPSCDYVPSSCLASLRTSCEIPTTRHYKYLHKVRSAVLASASNKNPKTSETSTNVSATLFTPQQGGYVCWCNLLLRRKLCTTAGFLERWIMHTCSKFITSTSIQQNSSWKLLMNIQPQKHRPVFYKGVQIFQSCKVEWKSIKKLQIQWNCRNIQNMPEIHHPCKSPSHISCKTCSHRHSDIGKLQFTDIPAKFHTPFWAVAVHAMQSPKKYNANTVQNRIL